MATKTLFLSACSAFTGVAFGAFGAHGLEKILSPEMLGVYKTAVTYHFWHALGLGLIAVYQQFNPDSRLLAWAAGLMFSGIIIFSGSLYLLALSNLKWLGMITPIGGIAFLSAWLLLAIYAYKQNQQESIDGH
jgi:uncharacterized membrane protein YgdD (TMEM256/DUF423 family)